VKRAPFDLGLWAVCTAIPFAVFGGAVAHEVWHRGWDVDRAAGLVGAVVASLFLGYGVYDGLSRRGWRVSRPRPEQAEDYGDGP
jgi:hypothetical protein